MKLSDGKRTVEIRMMNWTGDCYAPDFSNDFFDAGLLPYDEEHDVYIVDDVDYCIDQAHDWQTASGDFIDDQDDSNAECRFVHVEDIT